MRNPQGVTYVHNVIRKNVGFGQAGECGSGVQVIRDNVFVSGNVTILDCGSATKISATYNLNCAFCTASGGTGNISGTPIFVGGANPTTYAGWRLAPGSPGKGAASDGTDIGIGG
jgi:hypothetical protein